MNKPLKGVGYDLNSTNKGFSFAVHDPAYVEPGDNLMMGLNLPPFPVIALPQFQCFAVPGAGAYAGNTILTIVAGGVNYTNSNMPYIAEGVEQNFAQAFILKAAVVSTGITAVAGAIPTTSLAPLMLNNGFYALLNPANKYYVVLSYYDADGDPNALDVPILAERRPWISILEEGCTEFTKIFIEQGPSYYTGLLNIAPMTEYDDAGNPKKFFGFNHTGYFNPTKFGANVKIIAMIEAGVVYQYTNGGQNLTIPVHNHGTRMMYVPGMLEIDDPYYANEADDWSYVVNTADIQGLASVSYTGGWWDQVTDNTNPVAVTTHNYSYYSVSTGLTDNMGEFSCSVLGWPAEGGSSHRLRIKSGLVTFKTVTVDEEFGIISVNPEIKNLRINEPNIYPEDSLHIGLNDNPDYIHSDGYIELVEGSDYYVFLFKVIPNWAGDSETKAPQLVISKVSDAPNTAIVTKANGGGYTTAYLMVEEPTPVSNIVTADPETGYVGSFDPAIFNDPAQVTFHAEFLNVGRNNTPPDRDAYPAGMLAWLDAIMGTGVTVPVFTKKSTNPYYGSASANGNSIDGVPCGENWAKGNAGGGDAVTYLQDGTDQPYAVYLNETDSFNYIADNVLTGDDMSAFTYTPTNAYNMVSGYIDTQDFNIGLIDFGGSPEPVVEFKGEDIQISGTTTSLSFLAKTNIQDKLVGYTKTSCYRKDIAYIQWDGENSRFIVKQLHNGPVVIEDNPIHLGTTIIAADEDKGWIEGTDPTAAIVGVAFSGYTKSLNTGSTNQPDGSTTAGDYIPNQPSQIENPDIT